MERDATIAERDATLAAFRIRFADMQEMLTAQAKELRFLRREFEKLGLKKRGDDHLVDKGQMVLFDDDGSDAPNADEVSDEPDDESCNGRRKRKKSSRGIKKSLLDRVSITHELLEDERVCPKTEIKLVPVGEIVTEELDFVSAKLRIVDLPSISQDTSTAQDAQGY